MDPINRGPEDFGHDDDRDDAGRPRTTRDDGPTPAYGQGGAPPGKARTAQLVSGDLLLTINPIDGSEIEPCPPGRRPEAPRRHTPEERADLARTAGPPVPPGPAAPPLPLLERQEERERLVRLLARGRSVRLTGPAGSGRTALLDAVAADCADLAPDGVVRLSGHHRTPTELLHELFATVHHAPAHRPDRAGLPAAVHDIGAVVVLDDLEFGGAALDELLDATPECAFLLAATPDVAAPSADSHLEEVFLSGLDRSSALELLERIVDRPLTDDEANWAGDLWFESEGLPLRFVQAGALLRQRDELRAPSDDDEDSVFADGREAPLPSLGDGAAPAPLLASRLSESARETLRFAVALGGEVPHQAHLPALVNDTHADAALGELLRCGLLTPVGTRYRLAAGVMAQLVAKGYDEGAADRARTAAHHYAWWVGHPSVSPERAATEADAVLAALTALVKAAADAGPGGAPDADASVGTVFGGSGSGSPDSPGLSSSDDEEEGYADAAVVLARSAAPAFAAGLHWGAWERALRTGAEAARHAGEVAEEAYFHHELGVLALCAGNLDRARAELEASIAMRGALADKRGTVAGRRALALVADRERGPLPGGRTAAGEEVPAARYEESASPPGGVAAATSGPTPKPAALAGLGGDTETLIARQEPPAPVARPATRRTILNGARRNLVAAGAGALLAAVLGTVVTLGATSGGDDGKGGSGRVTSDQSANEDGGDGGLDADVPAEDSTRDPGSGDGGTGGSGSGSHSGSPGTPGSSASPGETGSAGNPTTPSGDPSTTSGATPTSSGPSSGSPTSSGPTTGAPTTGGSTSGGSTSGGTTSGGTTGGTTSGGSTSGDTTGGSTSGDTTGGSTSGDTTGGGSTTGDTTGGSTSGDTTSGSTTGETTSGAGGGTTSGGSTTGDTTSGATQSAPATSSSPTPSGTAA
ncbi:ATP-binding protein [Streptomyces sp. NPDC049837]|uniref:ATP-binding protein n=1 Tax=Streptomyces sp. NPDC049837 TaxID=3155277 RepID=UPI00343E5002